MILVVKSPVWDDLREIGLRIAEHSPDAADRFFTAAQEAFEMLRHHPHIGRLRSFTALFIPYSDEHHDRWRARAIDFEQSLTS